MTEKQEIAVRLIIDAWQVEGASPQTHREAKKWLLNNRPTLHGAISDLILAL